MAPGSVATNKPLTPTSRNRLNQAPGTTHRKKRTSTKTAQPAKKDKSKASSPTSRSPRSSEFAMSEGQAVEEEVKDDPVSAEREGEEDKDNVRSSPRLPRYFGVQAVYSYGSGVSGWSLRACLHYRPTQHISKATADQYSSNRRPLKTLMTQTNQPIQKPRPKTNPCADHHYHLPWNKTKLTALKAHMTTLP